MIRAKFLTKIIFSAIFILVTFESFTQIKSTYNKDNFINQLDLDLKGISFENRDKEAFNSIKKNYLSELDQESKEYFIEIANHTKSSGEKEFLSFFYYINWLLDNNLKNSTPINKILMYHYYVIYNPQGNIKNYFTSLWSKINSKTFIDKPGQKLYVQKNF